MNKQNRGLLGFITDDTENVKAPLYIPANAQNVQHQE